MAICALLAGALGAQPRFEVATIKPATDAEIASGSSGMQTGKGRVNAHNVTLQRCIIGAYAVGPSQIAGGPDWLDTAHFDILAKAAEPVGDSELMQMLRTLLAERFHLVLRAEERTAKAYLLETAKNGPKLQKSAPEAKFTTNNGYGQLDATGTTMPEFAQRLGRILDLPVVDRTGLDGAFDFKLRWTPEGAKADPTAPPGMFTAIQEQLGLKLTGGRAAVPVLVIVSATMPSEN